MQPNNRKVLLFNWLCVRWVLCTSDHFCAVLCYDCMRKRAKHGSTIISLNVITNTLKSINFSFFLNPFLPTSRTELHDSSCLFWLSGKFIWPNLTWQQGSHGSFISDFYDGAFTFVKMNQNPCFETNICKSARLNSNPLSTVLDDIPSTLSWPSIGGWESSVLRLVCGGLTCCELDALLLLSILEW